VIKKLDMKSKLTLEPDKNLKIRYPEFMDGDIFYNPNIIIQETSIYICTCYSNSDSSDFHGIRIMRISDGTIRALAQKINKKDLIPFYGKIIFNVDP
jgi:AAA15 family ATPase/GTPase